MNLARLRTRRQRLRCTWLVSLTLLFQQVALAAYICPVATTPPQATAMMAGCDGMEMPDSDASALCDQHCQPDHLKTPDPRVAEVLPLALPPLYFDLSTSLLPPAPGRHYENVPVSRSDPPPAARFCSLQI